MVNMASSSKNSVVKASHHRLSHSCQQAEGRKRIEPVTDLSWPIATWCVRALLSAHVHEPLSSFVAACWAQIFCSLSGCHMVCASWFTADWQAETKAERSDVSLENSSIAAPFNNGAATLFKPVLEFIWASLQWILCFCVLLMTFLTSVTDNGE